MAKYTVQITFEVSALRAPLKITHRLPGRAASMRWLAADRLLAVSASRVSADSPEAAALVVVKSVLDRWPKSQGPIKMLSWTAGRERVLVGARQGRSISGSAWPWLDGGFEGGSWIYGRDDDRDDDDGGGSAGVREPRRPLPGPGSLYAARDLP
jgi:hypothetical protein